MRRRLRDGTTWALILGVWSVVGLFLTLTYRRLTVGEAIVRGFGDAYLWAAVTAVAVLITRRLPIGQAPLRRALPIGQAPLRRALPTHLVTAIILPPNPPAFDAAAARVFGRVAAALRRSGRNPAARAYDALVAATALAHALPVYTCNPGDFAGIDELEVVPVLFR